MRAGMDVTMADGDFSEAGQERCADGVKAAMKRDLKRLPRKWRTSLIYQFLLFLQPELFLFPEL